MQQHLTNSNKIFKVKFYSFIPTTPISVIKHTRATWVAAELTATSGLDPIAFSVFTKH